MYATTLKQLAIHALGVIYAPSGKTRGPVCHSTAHTGYIWTQKHMYSFDGSTLCITSYSNICFIRFIYLQGEWSQL